MIDVINDNLDFVDAVEISAPLAAELSDLLATKSVRMELLRAVIDNDSEYELMEKKLKITMQLIDSIKHKITTECIPDKFRSSRYIWSYNGQAVDGNTIKIYAMNPVVR